MRVLITRPQEDAAPLVAELGAAGIDSFVEPLLNIETNLAAATKLDSVQAVLLTSRNGARALAEATEQRDVPIYAVGDATAGTARDLGFKNVESAMGDSAALAELIEDRLDPRDGELLHGSGTAVAGDLAGALATKGFTVRCEVLYEARPAGWLSAELQTLFTDGALDVASFFSPRTAQTFVKLINSAGLESACRAVTAICISPAVARMLEPVEFSDIRVASRPNACAMIAAIMDARARLKSMTKETTSAGDDEITGTRTGPETKIEAFVPPEDIRINPSDINVGEEASIVEPNEELAATDKEPPPTTENAKSGGGRKKTWFVLIALIAIGAGFATYPKWKSHIPASFLPGGQVATPVAPNQIAELEQKLTQIRDQNSDAINQVDTNVKTLEARIAAMEARFSSAELDGNRAAMATSEPTAIAQRIERVEKLIAENKFVRENDNSSAVAIAAMENRIKELESARDTLATEPRTPTLPSETEKTLATENKRLSAALESLTALLETIDQQVAQIETASVQNSEPGIGSRGGALIIAVGQLRIALTRSTPFQAELASVKAIAAGNTAVSQAVAPLTALAKDGVPTTALLKQRFDKVAAKTVRIALLSQETGWLNRTLARLSTVVNIRRIGDDVEGDTAQAILARAEARILADDLSSAVAELAKLTGAPAKSVSEWQGSAKARISADKAIAALTQIAIHRLAASDDAATK